MVDRNPSPPPGFQERSQELKGGQIGDTLFSQNWLFQTLLNIIKYTEKEEGACDGECPDQDLTSMDELPKELEDSMCTLWDMSADKDVAHFLLEFKARDIFFGIIEKTHAPRLLEIVAGILGNMAFYEDICEHFTESSGFVNAILQLLGTTDTPTLIQVIRLVHVSTANTNAGIVWINLLKSEGNYMNFLLNILENSLNVDLLKSTLKYLYCLLDEHIEVFSQWSTENLVNAVIVSASHFENINDHDSVIEYWHVLHLLSRADGYLGIVGTHGAVISKHLKFYARQFLDSEDLIPSSQHVSGLAAAFAVLNSLSAIENFDLAVLDVLKDRKVMQYTVELQACLQRKLGAQPEDETDFSNWKLLSDILTDTISLSRQITSLNDNNGC